MTCENDLKLTDLERIRSAHDIRIRKLEEHMNKCYTKIYSCEVNLSKLASSLINNKENTSSGVVGNSNQVSGSVYIGNDDLKFLCDVINHKQNEIDFLKKQINCLQDELKQANHKISVLESDNDYLQSQRLSPQGCKL